MRYINLQLTFAAVSIMYASKFKVRLLHELINRRLPETCKRWAILNWLQNSY